ncbi:MAG: tetratricopeptide repeat protein [Geobacteraceae bacterium]|nr:tetratricopeptide repeat protein [Geobacteraceae bacterium]
MPVDLEFYGKNTGGNIMRTMFLILSIVVTFGIFPVMSFGQNSAEDEARTYLVRGMAAIELAKSDDEFADAAEEFKKATKVSPNMAEAWYNLGAVQSKIGQLKEAIDSYNRYLTLMPRANDAQKIKDEVIKLGYRLEQTEKFKSLSGQWITSDGYFATVNAGGGKIAIDIQENVLFPGSSDVWMYNDQINTPNMYEYRAPAISLESRGSRLTGVLEFTGGSSSGGWCVLPGEKNQVEGTLEKGRILLRMIKMKFKVVMNSNDTLFSDPKVRCDGVAPNGTMTVDMILMGPLDTGGMNASYSKTKNGTIVVNTTNNSAKGLENGDEIFSVDGTDLAQITSYGARIMKLRGKPGSTVRLGIKRIIEKGGFFSKPKEAKLEISVSRVEGR